MTLQELLAGVPHCGDADGKLNITDVTDDARRVAPGSLFVCIRGARHDGHADARAAVASGASAVLAERDAGVSPQLLTPDARSAYARVCMNFFGDPAARMTLAAVTGTNGKTTVAHMVRSVMAASGVSAGLLGTAGVRIGDLTLPSELTTPDPYELARLLRRMLDAGCAFAVLEASSQALDQRRLDGCRFAAGAFTGFSQDHLDYHGDMERYFEAKMRLFSLCGRAAVNLDDAGGRRAAALLGEQAVTFSLSRDDADFTAKNIVGSSRGSSFIFVGRGLIQRMKVPMPGSFSVSNAMCAAAICTLLGVAPETIAAGLEACPQVPGRCEVLSDAPGFTVVRDFAHTPDGLAKITSALKEDAAGRLITLFGCGGDRDRAKRPLMGEAAGKNSDLVVLTSDNPRTEDPAAILAEIRPGLDKCGCEYKIIQDRETAIRWALENARDGDVVLLAGKGHETYQITSAGRVPFDEAQIVARILAERGE